MATKIERIKVSNPYKGKKKTSTKNPGYLAALGALNPNKTKGAKPMAVAKKKKGPTKAQASRPSTKKSAPKKKNPFFSMKSAPTKKRKTASNPDNIKPYEMAKSGMVILSGLVIARQLPQFALGADNQGYMGYAANAAVGIFGGLALSMFAGKKVGFEFAAGSMAYTISRVATEKLSPVGKYFSLAGVGDASAATMGDVRRAGVGIVRESSFNEPMLRTANGMVLIPPHIQAAIDAGRVPMMPVSVPPASAVGGRFSRR